MHRCATEEADLFLAGEPRRCMTLREAALATVTCPEAVWTDCAATLRRLHRHAAEPERQWWAGFCQRHAWRLCSLGVRVAVYEDAWTRAPGGSRVEVLHLPEEDAS
jgi:hypothetical protein